MRMVAMLVVDFRSHIHFQVKKKFDVSITLCHLDAKQTTTVTEIETTNIINTTMTTINTMITGTTTKATTTNGSYDHLN